jgi:hypothetical protein
MQGQGPHRVAHISDQGRAWQAVAGGVAVEHFAGLLGSQP